MTEQTKPKKTPAPRFGGDIVGGFFLVFLGIVFFLNNMGVIPWDIWNQLWKFWPILIILSGVNHIMGRSVISKLLVAVITLGVFAAISLHSIPQIGKFIPHMSNFSRVGKMFKHKKGFFDTKGFVSKTIELQEFSRMNISYPAKVTLVYGEESSASISATQSVLDNMDVSVIDGLLTIVYENEINPPFWPMAEIVITSTKDVDTLLIAGPGSIITKEVLSSEKLGLTVVGSGSIAAQVNTTELISEIAGSGNMKISGSTDSHEMKIAGSGSYYTFKLKTRTVSIDIAGSGNAQVSASESLDVTTLGSGDVTYTGSPKISQTVGGSGSVKPAEQTD